MRLGKKGGSQHRGKGTRSRCLPEVKAPGAIHITYGVKQIALTEPERAWRGRTSIKLVLVGIVAQNTKAPEPGHFTKRTLLLMDTGVERVT